MHRHNCRIIVRDGELLSAIMVAKAIQASDPKAIIEVDARDEGIPYANKWIMQWASWSEVR